MNYDPYQAPSAGFSPPPLPLGGQGISERAARELLGTQGWVRFVSILMLVATGFMFLSMILAVISPVSQSQPGPGYRGGSALDSGGNVAAQIAAFCIVGLLYLYPSVLLAKYASAINGFATATA